MKVISTYEDMLLLRAKMSLGNLFELIDLKKMKQVKSSKIYRLALARRFTLCYVAFVKYLMLRVDMEQSEFEKHDAQDILVRCRKHKLFDEHDERNVMQMNMMSTTLQSYENSYESITHDMLKGISRFAKFLDRFICTQRAIRLRDQAIEALR